MIKKFLSIIFIIFVFIFGFSNGVEASTTTIAPHWKKSKITVYIPQDTKSQSMRRAFSTWQSSINNKLTFEFVNEGPADIDVVFSENVSGADGPIGSYSVSIQGQEITKAEITIASKSPDFKKYSNNLVYTTMLHEVGHALGLADTNRKHSGIMFTPVSEEQDITKLDIRKVYNLYSWSYMDRRIEGK